MLLALVRRGRDRSRGSIQTKVLLIVLKTGHLKFFGEDQPIDMGTPSGDAGNITETEAGAINFNIWR